MALVLWENPRHHAAIRQLLRSDGVRFCDEDPWTEQETESFRRSRGYGADVRQYCPLTAVACSSQDTETQGPENVLIDDFEAFWSSRGSSETNDANIESMVFCIDGGPAIIRQICVKAFAAIYQAGAPIYPPRAVAFSVGDSASQMRPVSGIHHFAPNSKPQWFRLPDNLPPVTHFKIYFLGKRQHQREDNGLYHAIETVDVDAYQLTTLEKLRHLQESQGEDYISSSLSNSPSLQHYTQGTGPYDVDERDVEGTGADEGPKPRWSVELASSCVVQNIENLK